MSARYCPICSFDTRRLVWGNFVSCMRCGMVYSTVSKPFDYSVVENYAKSDPDPDRTKRTMDLLRPYIGKTTLEIGCGQGELLEALSKHTSAFGVDPSAANIDSCNARGLRVSQAVRLMGRKFDLIVVCHVLEHMVNVQDDLRYIRSQLSDNGHVYIEVPDSTRHIDHLTIPLQEFNEEHVNHFSPLLLIGALRSSGLCPVSFGTRSIPQTGGFYPAMWVVAKPGTPETLSVYDPLLGSLMREYAKQSDALLRLMADRAMDKLHGRQPIVWGAGILAEHLLPLIDPPPLQIIDRDGGKRGKVISGCKVEPPPPVNSHDPVLICSVIGSRSIQRDIETAGLQNEVIVLDGSKP